MFIQAKCAPGYIVEFMLRVVIGPVAFADVGEPALSSRRAGECDHMIWTEDVSVLKSLW